MQRVLLACVAAALVVTGCSSSSSGSTHPSGGGSQNALSGALTVDAASSLTGAFTTLKAQFIKAHPGVTISTNFGASSDLSTQISQGASVDVFASASTKTMTALGAKALSPANFAANTLEIAAPPSNPGKITSIADLAKPGVKVAVCDATVPCGAVAATVLKNAKITIKPTAVEADVKSTLATVESGEVDAGLVYVTDVRAAGSKVKGVPIATDINASTKYPIAVLKAAPNAALAKAFVDYALSATGRAVLAAAGFSTP